MKIWCKSGPLKYFKKWTPLSFAPPPNILACYATELMTQVTIPYPRVTLNNTLLFELVLRRYINN